MTVVNSEMQVVSNHLRIFWRRWEASACSRARSCIVASKSVYWHEWVEFWFFCNSMIESVKAMQIPSVSHEMPKLQPLIQTIGWSSTHTPPRTGLPRHLGPSILPLHLSSLPSWLWRALKTRSSVSVMEEEYRMQKAQTNIQKACVMVRCFTWFDSGFRLDCGTTMPCTATILINPSSLLFVYYCLYPPCCKRQSHHSILEWQNKMHVLGMGIGWHDAIYLQDTESKTNPLVDLLRVISISVAA